MNRRGYEHALECALSSLRSQLKLEPEETINTGLVLGTGWADAIAFEPTATASLKGLLGGLFDNLETVEGHSRRYEIGVFAGRRVIIQRGRVHMNEGTFDPTIKLAVRAQIELMIKLGVKNLILTTGVGALNRSTKVGSVMLIEDWVTSGCEEMPLFAGEFKSPSVAIDQNLLVRIDALADRDNLHVEIGKHVYWLGPHFESHKDKKRFAENDGDIISMSIKPECAVATLHPDVRVIPMGFVTNGPSEEMEHEHHRDVAKASAEQLGALLTWIVSTLPD